MLSSIKCLEAEIKLYSSLIAETCNGLIWDIHDINKLEAISDRNNGKRDDDTAFTAGTKKRSARKKTNQTIKNKKVFSLSTFITPFSNVTVVGDSHSRHLSSLLSYFSLQPG